MTGFANHPEFELKILDPRVGREWSFDFQTKGAAGIDLLACLDTEMIMWPKERYKFDAGIALHMKNSDYAMVILPRSSMGTKGLVLQHTLGLVDSDYQGQIIMPMMNIGDEAIGIRPGDRIAQAIFIPVIHPIFRVVGNFSEQSERGEGGRGSTGTNAAIDCRKRA